MSAHPGARVLAQWRARELAPDALAGVARHVAGCESCAEALPETWPAAQRFVRRAVAGGSHPSYEQLAAVIDARADAQAQARVEQHVAWCPICRRELADLAAAAPALRRPLAAPAARARSGGWRGALRALTHSAPTWVLAAIVGATALGVVVQQRDESGGSDGLRVAPDAGLGATIVLDESALSRLGTVSRAADAAYRAGDFGALAIALRGPADQGNPAAAAALGLLLAQGRGVPLDRARALSYWRAAAKAGDASAQRNLASLEAR
jgi:hypothetical protein